MQTYPIDSKAEMDKIIASCQVCYVGMTDLQGFPYVVPFNFGYDGEYIWLHSAKEGMKMDYMRNNPHVCVAFSTGHELYFQHEKVACSYGMKYKSVLVFGSIEWIDDHEKKIIGLNHVMKNYTSGDFSYSKPAVENVAVYRLRIEKMTGKKRGI